MLHPKIQSSKWQGGKMPIYYVAFEITDDKDKVVRNKILSLFETDTASYLSFTPVISNLYLLCYGGDSSSLLAKILSDFHQCKNELYQ